MPSIHAVVVLLVLGQEPTPPPAPADAPAETPQAAPEQVPVPEATPAPAPAPAPAPTPEPPAARRVRSRVGISLDALAPLAGNWGEPELAWGGSVYYWGEPHPFAFQLRAAAHLGLGRAESYLLHLAGDAGIAWVPIDASFSPLIGAGLGGHYLVQRSPTLTQSMGEVISLTTKSSTLDNFLVPGVYGRIGVVALRDARFSLAMFFDGVLLMSEGLRYPTAGIFSLGVQL